MARGSNRWAMVNRNKGESRDAWLARNHRAHVRAWKAGKIAAGKWIPDAEFVGGGTPRAIPRSAQETVSPAPGRSTPAGGATAGRPRTAPAAKPSRSTPSASDRTATEKPDIFGLAGYAAFLSAARELVRAGQDGCGARQAASRTAVAAGEGAAHAVIATMVRRGLEWRAAARVAASAGRQVLGRAGAQVATSGLRSVVRANAFAAVATGVAEQVIDTARLARGQIDCDEYGARSAENLARTGGAAGGAALGAAVGSAVPVLGTTIGALIGGFLGSLLGEGLASAAIR